MDQEERLAKAGEAVMDAVVHLPLDEIMAVLGSIVGAFALASDRDPNVSIRQVVGVAAGMVDGSLLKD